MSLLALGLVLASCSTEATKPRTSAPASQAQVASAGPAWLVELNRLRGIGGLKPVADSPELSRDCYAHAKYLIDQGPEGEAEFVDYRTDLGLGAHEENPQSKYYSTAGADCVHPSHLKPGFAQSNDVAWGTDAKADLDGLFYDAPFHRLSLLAKWATVAGYGEYGTWPRRVGVLSLKGEGWIGSPLITFPAEGSTVPVGQVSTFEVPNPLTSCPGYELPVGLPITVQLGTGYRGKLTSYSLRNASGPVEVCGFDWNSYQNPDASVQKAGREGLKMFGAMILVPKQPLKNDRYTVTVDTMRQKLEWSFTVAAEPEHQTITTRTR